MLVADILTNTLVRGHSAALQFDYCKGNTIDINDQIGATVACAVYGYLLGNLKIILHRVCPVDKVYHLLLFGHLRLHIHAVAQQGIDLLVGVVKSATKRACRLLEFGYGTAYLLVGIATTSEICRKILLLDITIALSLLPVAEISVLQYTL